MGSARFRSVLRTNRNTPIFFVGAALACRSAWGLARSRTPGGTCSLARFLLGRKPRLRRPAARADGLATNSPSRLVGCALLAVNAPPSGRLHAPLEIGAPAARSL